MLKIMIASLLVVAPFSVFALDSGNIQLPRRGELTFRCLGDNVERTYKGADVQALSLKRVSNQFSLKYELYVYDSLVLACDQITVR